MVFSLSTLSPESLKSEAKALRQEQADLGKIITHSEALELVSKAHGFANWNTATASLPERIHSPVNVGDKVEGAYLGQSFTGVVLGTSALPGASYYKVTLQLDEPVDVVTFESFSSFRSRVNGTVDAYGVSPEVTSNRLPILRIQKRRRNV